MSTTYLRAMLVRLVTILAILAITVMTTVASAHAARMSVEQDHTMRVGEMMHAAASSAHSCEAAGHGGSADAELCKRVCAGLSAFLTSPGAEAGLEHRLAIHHFPSEASHVGRAPGLNERPPKLRLL